MPTYISMVVGKQYKQRRISMRYQVWDKQSDILTPAGKLFTADEWREQYPISKYVDIVISGGEINGAVMQIYSQFKEDWERRGLDFSKCKTQQEVLDMIEEAENEQYKPIETTNYQEEMMYALQDIAVNTMPMEEL